MPFVDLDGVKIYFEQAGDSGDPLVLVHGSWNDHHTWDFIVPELAKSFRVFTYDRRGHSQSTSPAGQGSIHEDVDDLATLIERLDIAPAHIVGNSGGGAVVLRLAIRRPELFRTMSVHEPALFGILANVPEARAGLTEVNRRVGAVLELLERSEWEKGARLFVESVAFGPGQWEKLPEATRQTFVHNAPTFLDECHDPECLQLDTAKLKGFPHRALLTRGSASPPFFPIVVQQITAALPEAKEHVYAGAGHVPHLTHPSDFSRTVGEWARGAA